MALEGEPRISLRRVLETCASLANDFAASLGEEIHEQPDGSQKPETAQKGENLITEIIEPKRV